MNVPRTSLSELRQKFSEQARKFFVLRQKFFLSPQKFLRLSLLGFLPALNAVAQAPDDYFAAPEDTLPAEVAPAPAALRPAACVDADSLTAVLVCRLDSIVSDPVLERTQLGLYVYDLTEDRPIYEFGHRQTLRPASCQKIVTAVTALDRLGTDYSYRTSLLLEGTMEDSLLCGNIIVRAGYDPLFSAEDMQAFARALRREGVRAITGDVVLDISMKDTLRWGWGWCWDDGKLPLTPLLYEGGTHFRRRMAEVLAADSLSVLGVWRTGQPTTDTREICVRQRSIDAVLLTMMKESNNYYAESMFYQLAARSRKPFATRREAIAEINALVRQMGFDPADYQMADGSGLSLYNYLSPELLVGFLRYAYQHPDIYRHLLPSLPEAGADGTLRKRLRGTAAAHNVRAKTGTVTGVSSLSGYCTAADGHILAFAIINQGVRRAQVGKNIQDAVCRALTEP